MDKEAIRQRLMRQERGLRADAGYAVKGMEPCPRRCAGYLSERVDGWATCDVCGLKDWRPDSHLMEYMATRDWGDSVSEYS